MSRKEISCIVDVSNEKGGIFVFEIPKSKEEFFVLGQKTGTVLPWTDDFSVLSTPLCVGRKQAPNRICYQAMEGCDGTADGAPDALTLRRYERFAKGGAGIIWFEATAVCEEARANPRQLWITKENVSAFADAVNRIRETCLRENGYTPLIICQLTHSGRYSKPHGTPAPLIAYNNPLFEKDKPIAADRIVSDEYLDTVSEMLSDAAVLAEKAGFDGVDIKCCHRYLNSELLSAFNRTGRYGGSFENRTRLLRESVQKAITKCARDFIVSTRLNIYDGFEYPYGFGVNKDSGLTPDYTEPVRLVKELVLLGMPLINITMGNPYVNPHVNRPFAAGLYDPPEEPLFGVQRMLDGTAIIKKAVGDVPVICSGLSFLGITAANCTAAYIENGGFDFAGFGRQTLAYPDIAKDITKNNIKSKKLCICCGKCSELMRAGGTPGCIVRDAALYAPMYKEKVKNA